MRVGETGWQRTVRPNFHQAAISCESWPPGCRYRMGVRLVSTTALVMLVLLHAH